jgi:hypothetical protein
MKWGPVKQLLENKGIQSEYSLPYAHYQNLVERYVQTITKAVSTIIHGQSLLKASLRYYALFYVVDCCNATPNTKTGHQTPNQLVTGTKYLDLQHEHLFSFGELVIVCNTEKTWKFDVKNDVAIYIGHPKGTVNGGIVYYPYINKIAQCMDITPANIPEEVYKQYFARHYEVKEQSTAKTLSELFENLECESNDPEALRFKLQLLDENEIPKRPHS